VKGDWVLFAKQRVCKEAKIGKKQTDEKEREKKLHEMGS